MPLKSPGVVMVWFFVVMMWCRFDVPPLRLRCCGVMMSGRCRISTVQRRAIVMPQGFAAAMACISDGVMLWWHHSTMPWLRNGFMLGWHSAVVLRHYSIAMLWWLTELMMLVVVLLP